MISKFHSSFFLTVSIFCVGCGVGIPTAHAVDALDPCQRVAEEIIPLRVPDFDQAAVWKKTSGVKGADRPKALLPVVDGGQIVIGTSIRYNERTGFTPPEMQMVRTDKNGKIVVEKFMPVDGLTAVADALLLKDRIVVVSQIKVENIGLTFLNGIGEVKGSNIISDAKRRLVPKSVMSLPGGEKMVIAAESIARKNPADSFTVLIWTDKDGKKLSQKEYLPGVRNKPEYIGRLSDGEIAVTGRVVTEDGRDAGWVLRLGPTGDILYQRPYARGGDSVVRRAVALPDHQMIVVGDALPSMTGDKAAWVMKLSADGEPVWQKYLTGKYAYTGLDVVALENGYYNVLLAGKPTESGGRNYARVVTLSPEGVVMGDESFIEGSNAIPTRIIQQKGKRVLLGMAETGFTKDKASEEMKYVAYDSWILGMAASQPVPNNCAGAPDRTLDDLP